MMIITPHFLYILVPLSMLLRVLTTDLTFYVKGILIVDINRRAYMMGKKGNSQFQ
jgi:hypothetical protein